MYCSTLTKGQQFDIPETENMAKTRGIRVVMNVEDDPNPRKNTESMTS